MWLKPFNPLELTARVKSQLRRYTQLNPNSGSRSDAAKNEIAIKGLVINKDNHKVTVYDEEIKLTPIEFDILYLLASNPGNDVQHPMRFSKRSGMKRFMRPIIRSWYIFAACVAR